MATVQLPPLSLKFKNELPPVVKQELEQLIQAIRISLGLLNT